MKCPNCGEEMADGKLYCEHCGEDIHIVPDFEPELERSMELTMEGIFDELQEMSEEKWGVDNDAIASAGPMEEQNMRSGKAEDFGEWGRETHAEEGLAGWNERECGDWEDSAADGKAKRKRRVVLCVSLAFMLLILLAAVFAAWVVYVYNSEEHLLERAEQYTASGKYDKAVSAYERLLEMDKGNVQFAFAVAEVYLLMNNKVEYEFYLREIINNKNATIEQLDSAYGKLIAIYRAREDYQTINDLLLSSGNDTLLSTYQGYIAREPEFSVMEGYYTSIQQLKLTVIGTGSIYYTMDGSEPSEQSAQYTAPIILENGDYIIKACFVNDRGVASETVSKEYHIDNDEIPPPEISAISGRYYSAFNIEVLNDDENVYYTTDGTDPTYQSILYTGPIIAPLGKSVYKFARVVDGVTGEVAERNYEFVLNTEITPELAVNSVVEYIMSTGKLLDTQGHYDDSENVYQYMYQYVTNINESGDFYVIVEVIKTADGISTRTGNNFAVNVYTGERFKLQQDEYDNLFLVEIEPKEDSDSSEE